MTTLKNEYQFFEKNLTDLLRNYRGKFIVIKDSKVIGSYNNETEAYDNTVKNNELGTFLIQQCLPEKDLPPQVYCSRVIF